VIWLLGPFWVDTPHINTFEGDSVLSKLVLCSPPSRHGHASRDSNYVNGSASLKNVFGKIPRSAWALSSRGTKQLETVAMRVLAATGSFYFARGIGSQASVGAAVDEEHWAEETACKRKRIETSLVFVTIMLHVLTYVVSNKLFWNWNSVVRFVSQEVWFDKGFVI